MLKLRVLTMLHAFASDAEALAAGRRLEELDLELRNRISLTSQPTQNSVNPTSFCAPNASFCTATSQQQPKRGSVGSVAGAAASSPKAAPTSEVGAHPDVQPSKSLVLSGSPHNLARTGSRLQGTAQPEVVVSPAVIAAMAAVNAYFRFAFEELTLRWQTMDSKPFSLNVYHDLMGKQIERRKEAQQLQCVTMQQVANIEAKLEAQMAQSEKRRALYEENVHQYYSELFLLRQRVVDLQNQLSIKEPPPRLLDCPETRSEPKPQMEEDSERHIEGLYKASQQENDLLKATLAERTAALKLLEEEISSARAELGSVKLRFREYLDQQEQIDEEFRLSVSNSAAQIQQANDRVQAVENELRVQQMEFNEEKRLLLIQPMKEIARLTKVVEDTNAALAEAKAQAEANAGKRPRCVGSRRPACH